MDFKHYSVLLDESVDALKLGNNKIYVDATMGGGGHSEHILNSNPNVKLICIDQDEDAIIAAKARLERFKGRFTIVKDNFKNIKNILASLDIQKVDGIIADLGVSSFQLDTVERGFSYMQDSPLDMRMDKSAVLSAYEVVNNYSADKLTKILFEYGEEKFSRRIVEFILRQREISPIESTGKLVEIIRNAIPKKYAIEGGHPAKRTFQAIRIEVNEEISILTQAITDFCDLLMPEGRLSVISFHSLEDRIVKNVFVKQSTGCTCPKDFPVCICGNKPKVKLISRKPILPNQKELEENSRSKSAKLRVCEKI